MIQVIGKKKPRATMQIDLQSTETYTEKRPSVVGKQTSESDEHHCEHTQFSLSKLASCYMYR